MLGALGNLLESSCASLQWDGSGGVEYSAPGVSGLIRTRAHFHRSHMCLTGGCRMMVEPIPTLFTSWKDNFVCCVGLGHGIECSFGCTPSLFVF